MQERVLNRRGDRRLVTVQAANELLGRAVLDAVCCVDDQARDQVLRDQAVQEVHDEDAARDADHAAFQVNALALHGAELVVDDLKKRAEVETNNRN